MNAISTFQNFFQFVVSPFSDKGENQKLNFEELLLMSWLMQLVWAFYSIFTVYLGLVTYRYMSNESTISSMIMSEINFKFQKFSIIFLLSEIILYPVIFFFTYRFMKTVLNFYADIFLFEGDRDETFHQVLTPFYCANVFLLLPIGGRVLSYFAQAYYLYRGLIKKMEFTNLQSILVLLTPLFLVFLFAILIVAYFTFLLSLI
jgi:hypothetical protein